MKNYLGFDLIGLMFEKYFGKQPKLKVLLWIWFKYFKTCFGWLKGWKYCFNDGLV